MASQKKRRAGPQTRPYNEPEFQELLLSEYAMLQAKIDTIGGFRITIKGWSVVAVAGAAAASTRTGSAATLLLSLGLVVLIGISFLLEFEQVRLSSLYAARAGRIERALIAIRLGNGEARAKRMPVPFTANEIVLAKMSGTYSDGDSFRKVASRSHAELYFALCALALLIGGRHWIELYRLCSVYFQLHGLHLFRLLRSLPGVPCR